MSGLKEAFAKFGVAGRNQRWNWSARSDDGETVVLTLWQDLVKVRDGNVHYDTFGLRVEQWEDTPGNQERLENLIWARDKCEGEFRFVITVAADTEAYPRKIASCFARPDWIMKLSDLDETTGEFRAEKVAQA
ncbi:MAG: hypothetical protein RLO21_15870 [Nitratireductor sp.]